MRKILAGFIIPFLILIFFTPNSSAENTFAYTVSGNLGKAQNNPTEGWTWDTHSQPSFYVGPVSFNQPYVAGEKHCYLIKPTPKGLNECDVVEYISQMRSHLEGSYFSNAFAPCNGRVVNHCINSVRLRNSDGFGSPLIFDGYLKRRTIPKELQEAGLPEVGGISLWKIDPAYTEHGSESMIVIPRAGYVADRLGNWSETNLDVEISPIYKLDAKNLPIGDPKKFTAVPGFEPATFVGNHLCPSQTVHIQDGYCYVRDRFKNGITIETSFRTSKSLPLRFSTRTNSTFINSTDMGSDRLITLTGMPIDVPAVQFFDRTRAVQFRPLNGASYVAGSTQKILVALRTFMKDQSNFLIQQWKFSTAEPIQVTKTAPVSVRNRAIKCLSDFRDITQTLETVVSSNAMLGQASGPTFDGKQITYQLGGLHRTVDGKVFDGTYEAQVDMGLAKCIYGITGSPKATISITDAGGGLQKVVTQYFKQEGSMLRIGLSGFHFSDPVVAISLK